MSNSKHNNSKAFKRFLVIILTLAIIAVAFMFIRSKLATDEVTIQSEYHDYVAKHELLKAIADDAIHEGNCVDITVFTDKNVMYKVYNNEDNTILVHYWLEEEIGNDLPFFAKILLSNDYQIINEEYSSAEEYETFKWKFQFKENMLFILYGIFVFAAFYVIVCFFYGFISVTGWIAKLFKREKRAKVPVEPESDNSDDEDVQDNT